MTTGPISDSPVLPMALFVSPYTPSHSLSLSNLTLLQSFLAYTSYLFYSPTFCPQALKLFTFFLSASICNFLKSCFSLGARKRLVTATFSDLDYLIINAQ